MPPASPAVQLLAFPSQLQPLRERLVDLVQILEGGRESSWYAFATAHDSGTKQVVVSLAEQLSVTSDRGVVLRIFAGGRNFEAATNELDKLEDLARALRAEVEATDLDPEAPGYSPLTWDEEDRAGLHPLMLEQLPDRLDAATEVHFGVPVQIHPDQTQIADMVTSAREARAALEARVAADDHSLANSSLFVSQTVSTTLFVDRHKNLSQSLAVSIGRVFAFAATNDFFSEHAGGLGGIELAAITPQAIDKVATMPFDLAAAERLTPGRYPVITGPEMTGVLAHEAFGHTQEGDTRMLGRSCAPALQAAGEPVGVPAATIISNPAVFSTNEDAYGSNGSYFFDDEGQLARPHAILDHGVVGSPMNNLMSAVVGDENGPAPRQSNGRRESWRRPIFSRQSNTYFTPGDKTLDELIGMVEHGYLAEWASGGMEDPKGMRLTASTRYLAEIREGKLTGKLFVGPQGGHVELADPVPVILKGLVAKTRTAGDALPKVHIGGCMKYHKEYVPAGIGGPWILWSGIQCG